MHLRQPQRERSEVGDRRAHQLIAHAHLDTGGRERARGERLREGLTKKHLGPCCISVKAKGPLVTVLCDVYLCGHAAAAGGRPAWQSPLPAGVETHDDGRVPEETQAGPKP